MKPRIQCVLTQWKPGFIASVASPATLSGPLPRPFPARYRGLPTAPSGSFGRLVNVMQSLCDDL